MQVWINEVKQDVDDDCTIAELRERFAPDSDLAIRDGAPADDNDRPRPDSRIVFIRRGQIPSAKELETLIAARCTPGVYARLKRAHVLVCGLGGLGSVAATALARTGVGKLTLVDFDVVEPSNLNRQTYFADQIGKPKPLALAETLRRVNPYTQLACITKRLVPADFPNLLPGVDVTLECFDTAEAKAMLLESVRSLAPDMPIVMGSGMAGHGQLDRLRVTTPMEGVFVVGDGESEVQPGLGLMAPRVGVVAAMQADVALTCILASNDMEPTQ